MKRRIVLRVNGGGSSGHVPRAKVADPEHPVVAVGGRDLSRFHVAWRTDGLGATFYVAGAQVMCIPDPGLTDSPTEVAQLGAARAQLLAALGLDVEAPVAPPAVARASRVHQVPRSARLLRTLEWRPSLVPARNQPEGADEEPDLAAGVVVAAVGGPFEVLPLPVGRAADGDDALDPARPEDEVDGVDELDEEIDDRPEAAFDEQTIAELVLGHELQRAMTEGFGSDAVLARAMAVRDRVVSVVGWDYLVAAFLTPGCDDADETVESIMAQALDASGYQDARAFLFPAELPPPQP